MNSFNCYYPTKIYFSSNSEEDIGRVLQEQNCKNLLILYGSDRIVKSGLLNRIKKSIEAYNISIYEYKGIEGNPTIQLCNLITKQWFDKNIDSILACGGGAVIDTAKMVSVCLKDNLDARAIMKKEIPITNNLPVFSVLTLPASGSEANDSVVMTDSETQLKRGMRSPYFFPKAAFLNPENTYTIPLKQSVFCLVDAMSHIIERYINLDENNSDLIDGMAESVLRTLLNAGNKLKTNLSDNQARSDIMLGALFANSGILGLGNYSVVNAHYMEHELSGFNPKLPHSVGMTIILCPYLKYIASINPKRISRLAVNVFGINSSESDYKTALEGVTYLQNFINSFDINVNLTQFGFGVKDLPIIADKCTSGDKFPLKSYKPLLSEDVENIYRECI